MQHSEVIPVLLAGGAGTGLWPHSRERHPKQLLPLVTHQTMLQDTAERAASVSAAPPIVMCHEDHRFLVAEQLRPYGTRPRIVLEPEGRGTAPSVVIAALDASTGGSDPVVLVLPCDHVVAEPTAWLEAIAEGLKKARLGALVAFGSPEKHVGIYICRVSVLLAVAERVVPDLVRACRAAHEASKPDLDFLRLDAALFRHAPLASIEQVFAGCETLALDCGDIDSWSTLCEAHRADENENVLLGDTATLHVRGCYIHSGHRLVAAVGLEDAVVVETADAVLVAPKSRVAEVGRLVAELRAHGREEVMTHRRVARPWGAYETLDRGGRFQVKRITVSPGANLSLQAHQRRAEHWVVVEGVARVTRGDDVFLLRANESTFIPLGVTHRLENPGNVPLQIIEVQSGDYLGEDDIVRFQDCYGRGSSFAPK